MNIREVLQTIDAYYQTSRQVGHTTLMKRGISNYEHRKLVMVHNMSYGRDLRVRNNELVTPNSLDRLRGNDLPLVIDNGVLSEIFREAFQEYTRLESQRDAHRAMAYEFETTINTMRANPFKTLFKTLWRRW